MFTSPPRVRVVALGLSATLFCAAVAATAPSAAAATAKPCSNAALAVTQTPAEGATGHGSFVLLFRNVTSSACSLYGYPGLDALNRSGHVLAHARRKLHGFAGGAAAVARVTVRPGRYASSTVEWLNFDPATSGDCVYSKSVATTPANTTHTVHLAQSVSICRLQIHPTVAGTSGNPHFAAAQVWWIRGAASDSANQGLYWSRARAALATTGSGSTGSLFSREITELTQLIALPDADQTPTQNARYRHHVADLDAFFATPHLYQ